MRVMRGGLNHAGSLRGPVVLSILVFRTGMRGCRRAVYFRCTVMMMVCKMRVEMPVRG